MASMHQSTAITEELPTFQACTKFNDEKLCFIWTIHNFSSRQEDFGKKIESSVLTSASRLTWYMELFPKGLMADCDEGYVSLYLTLLSSSDVTTCPEVKFEFTILNAKLEPVLNLVDRGYFSRTFKRPGIGHGWPKFVNRDELIAFLKDDPLIISCKLVVCGMKRIDNSGWSCTFPVPSCTLSDDLRSSFEDSSAGDTIIEVDGKEFLVYRGILQARSSVFAAMFQHEMKEQIKNRVIITDFEPEIVEEMLIYIYTGKSPNLQAMANDLISIADKYNLERLKMMSADVLSRKLTNENATGTLILADLYRVSELKKFVINFITNNSFHFMSAEIWKNIISSLSTTHPNLIVEVTGALFSTNRNVHTYP